MTMAIPTMERKPMAILFGCRLHMGGRAVGGDGNAVDGHDATGRKAFSRYPKRGLGRMSFVIMVISKSLFGLSHDSCSNFSG